MKTDYEKMSAYDQLQAGLKESLAHARGALNLRTTVLPAPPPSMPPARVVRLRKRLQMSQRIFAAYLNVSLKLVQTWEQGSRVPRGGALRLLELLDRHAEVVRMMGEALPLLNGEPRKNSRYGPSVGAKSRRRVA